MITIRSSTTARVSRKARSAVGRFEPDHRQHGEREGDVGGRRDRPAVRAAVAAHGVDAQVDQRRYGDPAGRRDDRHRGVGRPSQRPDDELSLELEAGHEEEQRQRAVGRPVLEVERADLAGAAGRRTALRPGRVGPQHADHGRGQGERAAERLATEEVPEEASPRAGPGSGRSRRTNDTMGSPIGARRRRRTTCRPDFPAHRLSS